VEARYALGAMTRTCRRRPGARRHEWGALALLWALLSAGCAGPTVSPASTAAPTTLPLHNTAVIAELSAPPTTEALPTTLATAASTSMASAPATTATTATATTTLPEWRRPLNPDDPLRAWVVGDSLAGPLGNALAGRGATLGLLAVVIDYQGGTGLTREDLFDWPGTAAQRLPEVAPDVVVSLLGANDGQALRLPGGRLEFGSPEWDREYTGRVGAFMDLLAGGSRRVYWVGVPTMSDPDYDARVRHINALAQQEAATRQQLVYVDAYSLVQDEEGRFATQLVDEAGDLVTVRLSDGTHLTSAGADRLALAVLHRVATDWGFEVLLGS
jgi:hypothetical protein